ncbi:MAG: alpha-mannosidase [Phycisphaeraceae bacterium]|nr:alpha-mannosidase [Phycisphaeraceae bacterium]
MAKTSLHLVCNAHLDPVWLWEWQEGAAEAISTFRTAADLCEEFPGFIFNHNEAVLYEWVQEYEPQLFKRIQKLVKQGKWHIMGGWFLQPDCNMPSGEAYLRSLLYGRRYFKKHFNAEPTTAINFDSFGHSRGLVQIMAKSGFDSYMYCRPPLDQCPIPADNYYWVGYDGSKLLNGRARMMYNSPLGNAVGKFKGLLPTYKDRPCAYILWGVGDHGGGPSRQDLRAIAKFMKEDHGFEVLHSTPEAYFKEAGKKIKDIPELAKDLKPFAVGCYTSMVRIKQMYRKLENELFTTEKMATAATLQGLMPAAADELAAAERDLLFAQFHDILPGSSIQPVEEAALRMMNHGLEILSRVKTRAFFALASGQPKAAPGEFPILVYNPLPRPVEALVECEMQLADQGWGNVFSYPEVYDAAGRKQPTQIEHELSNLPLDWRKHVVFQTTLQPSQMNRFNCRYQQLKKKPDAKLKVKAGKIRFANRDGLEVVISARTGLVERWRVKGRDVAAPDAFRPIVIADNCDPWGMTVRSFRKKIGSFSLMSARETAVFSGLGDQKGLPAVRVVEDGEVRSVVEVTLKYGDSRICQRYKLPRQGTEVEVELRVFWEEKDRMLKLSVPLSKGLATKAKYVGETAFGYGELADNGEEAVAQKWTAVVSRSGGLALSCINEGCYGSDFDGSELRLSLLRSASYSAHPIENRKILPEDRFTARIDQGERIFRFWFNAGPIAARLQEVPNEALVRNEKPYALSFNPSGQGPRPKVGPMVDDAVVQMTACKPAAAGQGNPGDLIVRLFNPTDRPRTAKLSIPVLGLRAQKVTLGKFEVQTLRINPRTRKVTATNLMEKPV